VTAGSGTPGSSSSHASPVTRVLHTLIRPRQALKAAASNGSWAWWALMLAAVPGLARALFLSTSVGQLALVDQWERTATAFGGRIDDGSYAVLQASAERFWALYAIGSACLRGPVLSALLALLLQFAYRGARERRPAFASTAAVVVQASAILALRDLVATPVSYLREAVTAPGSLGLWFPVLNANSPLARLLGVVDVFVVWWIVVLAIGVSVLHARPARRLALLFLGVYLVVALLLALVMAAADTGA